MELKSVKLLEEKNIEYRLIKLSETGVSFEDVLKHAEDEINPNEICKTIIVKDKKGERYAFFLKGDQKIDSSKAKGVIGRKFTIISYKDLQEAIGAEPGAVCPLLLNLPVFIDKKVFDTEKINFGSGDPLYGIEIFSRDLKKALNAFKIVKITK